MVEILPPPKPTSSPTHKAPPTPHGEGNHSTLWQRVGQWLLSPSRRRWIGVVAIATIGVDQWIKYAIHGQLALGESWPLWPRVFHMTLVHNDGVAFSLLSGLSPLWFVALALLMVVAMGLYVWKLSRLTTAEALGVALIMGGALGNMIDRIRLGEVVDYLDVRLINFPVFNLADSAIFIGVCLVAVGWILLEWQQQPNSKPSPPSPPDSE